MPQDPFHLPREAAAGIIGLCVAGGVALCLKGLELYEWHAKRQALRKSSISRHTSPSSSSPVEFHGRS
jgi:hypothetical protein